MRLSEVEAAFEPVNPRRHDVPGIADSIRLRGFNAPPLLNEKTGRLVYGHGRTKAVRRLFDADPEAVPKRIRRDKGGEWMLPVFRGVEFKTKHEAEEYLVADNRLTELGGWDPEPTAKILERIRKRGKLEGTGWTTAQVEQLLKRVRSHTGAAPTLADRFVVPPFSVLDAKQGYWQERKKKWLAMGIKSELGRAGLKNTNSSPHADRITGYKSTQGGSIFDPVLAEIACRWFSNEGARVLDPFAGGSVRGVVAACLNRIYTGIELRTEQVEANREQWADMATRTDVTAEPVWIEGDSGQVVPGLTGAFDLILSCPPYFDLEVYSKDPADISNMGWDEFMAAYRQIIAASVDKLADNRFIFWVVGEVRGKDGLCIGFVPETIRAFADAGAGLYNEAILATPLGTLPVRAGRIFSSARKMLRAHQTVLVFVKGDPKLATEACGEVVVDGQVDEETPA